MKLLRVLLIGLLSVGVMIPGTVLADSRPDAPPVNDATSQSATQVLKTVSGKLIVRLRDDKKAINRDPFAIIDIVDKIIMPITDFELIAKRVLGTHWNDANEAQQKKFMKEFKLLLIVTYIAAFRSYDNQTVGFKTEMVDPEDPTRVEVQTVIQQSGSPDIPVNYRLHKVNVEGPKGGPRWFVYDFNVEGVGLTSSFRQQFDQAIQQKGINQMLQDMHKKNEEFFGRE